MAKLVSKAVLSAGMITAIIACSGQATPTPMPTATSLPIAEATATAVPNSSPSIKNIAYPTRVDPNGDYTVKVQAADADDGLKQIRVLDDAGKVLASQDCSALPECNVDLLIKAPGEIVPRYSLNVAAGDTNGARREYTIQISIDYEISHSATKQGKFTLQQYVERLQQTHPQLRGVEMLAAPSKFELEERLRDRLQSKEPEMYLDQIVSESLAVVTDDAADILPLSLGVYQVKGSHLLHIGPRMLDDFRDEDHFVFYLSHAAGMYKLLEDGLSYSDGNSITREDILEGKVHPSFLVWAIDTKSMHDVMRDELLSILPASGDFSGIIDESEDAIAENLASYGAAYFRLRDSASSEREKELLKSHFADLTAIRPLDEGLQRFEIRVGGFVGTISANVGLQY